MMTVLLLMGGILLLAGLGLLTARDEALEREAAGS
jgi:hypothetical protein